MQKQAINFTAAAIFILPSLLIRLPIFLVQVKYSIFKERKPKQSFQSRERTGYTIVARSGWFKNKNYIES